VAAESPVVVFDFDGTLVHGDSVTRFAIDYLLHRPGRLLFVLPFLPAAAACLPFHRTRTPGVSLFWWALSFGTRSRRLVEALRAYAESELVQHINEASFAELRDRLARGESVVIATAAPPVIVRGLFRARGLAGARIAGTHTARCCGGLVTSPHCIGETKVHELERRFGLSAWTEVYTDSALDLPIMRRAAAVTLVEPSKFTLARVERALGAAVRLRVLRDGP
jgi:phosphatidylglycerophosphatase C